MSYGYYFDMTNCIGCRACQIACKDKNDLSVGLFFRRVESYETGEFPKPGFYHLSRTCNHCESPVANCPTGAMGKDPETGMVLHDDEACIGCQTCVNACPYEIPQYIEEANVVHKCDMCQDLVENGERPACIDACPMRCLEWGDFEELRSKHKDAVGNVDVLPPEEQTTPCSLVKAKLEAVGQSFERKYI